MRMPSAILNSIDMHFGCVQAILLGQSNKYMVRPRLNPVTQIQDLFLLVLTDLNYQNLFIVVFITFLCLCLECHHFRYKEVRCKQSDVTICIANASKTKKSLILGHITQTPGDIISKGVCIIYSL